MRADKLEAAMLSDITLYHEIN